MVQEFTIALEGFGAYLTLHDGGHFHVHPLHVHVLVSPSAQGLAADFTLERLFIEVDGRLLDLKADFLLEALAAGLTIVLLEAHLHWQHPKCLPNKSNNNNSNKQQN